MHTGEAMKIYFSDFFEVSTDKLEKYGAFNISLLNDLPLFIDPFLLFNSKKAKYKKLHRQIIDYVIFLKGISTKNIDDALVRSLFTFREVKQNWFGYSKTGNSGSGLGNKFAFALRNNLTNIFVNFGEEDISDGTHLEKLCLIDDGVGRDNISDFSTNLIKEFLLEYTQSFAEKNIDKKFIKKVHVQKVSFNHDTLSWSSGYYMLPYFNNDFILLTPKDILTKDDSWINKTDISKHVSDVIHSVPNDELRSHMNQYFISQFPISRNKNITKKDEQRALRLLIKQYPEFLDYYIRFKEINGNRAVAISEERVKNTEIMFINQLLSLAKLLEKTDFYKTNGTSHKEAKSRVLFLKHVIEDNDGYRLFYFKGEPVKRESDLQIIFKLTWHASDFDVNAEVNNGRGPVDFKISRGSSDKTLVEFKLASNSKLKQNLANQVKIYELANNSKNSIKVILFFSYDEGRKVKKILKELKLETDENIVLIDARKDNKISASNVHHKN